MRTDMKDVIINTGRYGGYAGFKAVRNSKEFKRYKQDDECDHPTSGYKSPYVKYHGTKQRGQSDRLTPLKRFLKKHVGLKWDDVWKKICEQCDDRNIRGYHLRDHVKYYIKDVPTNSYRYSIYSERFWVDDQGILRYYPGKDPWEEYREKEKERKKSFIPTFFPLGENFGFEWHKTTWFLVGKYYTYDQFGIRTGSGWTKIRAVNSKQAAKLIKKMS